MHSNWGFMVSHGYPTFFYNGVPRASFPTNLWSFCEVTTLQEAKLIHFHVCRFPNHI